MKRILFLILLCSVALSAAIDLEFRDFNSNDLLQDANVLVNLTNLDTGQSIILEENIGTSGSISLTLETGPWLIFAKLDDTKTFGSDYVAESFTNVQSDLTIKVFLRPAGSLRGTVVDESGNLVAGATVKLDCSGYDTESSAIDTDEFGAFSVDWIPVGSCKVFARLGDKTGSATSQIDQGSISEIEVSLKQSLSNPLIQHPVRYFAISAALNLLLLAIIAFFYFKFVRKPSSPVIEQKIDTAEGIEDLMRTMNDRELAVINHLLEHEGKSNLKKLFRATNIPKTSLVRCLQGLEKKNIVKMEKHGKSRNIALENWFMLKK